MKLCECGCGQPTLPAQRTSRRDGTVRGEPQRFVRYHHHRLPKGPPVEDRFWTKVKKTDTCWLWTGTKPDGYGRFYYDGAKRPAHRFAYELLVGPIPAGLEIDHLCRNHGCVNPDHLEPVTHAENLRRGKTRAWWNERKTHCKHGHPFTPENTYTYPGRKKRGCRTCTRERHRRYAAAA